jgi:hypothetical protein
MSPPKVVVVVVAAAVIPFFTIDSDDIGMSVMITTMIISQ